eukprot:1144426-Pelagomonas_calceolata.AAC.3
MEVNLAEWDVRVDWQARGAEAWAGADGAAKGTRLEAEGKGQRIWGRGRGVRAGWHADGGGPRKGRADGGRIKKVGYGGREGSHGDQEMYQEGQLRSIASWLLNMQVTRQGLYTSAASKQT